MKDHSNIVIDIECTGLRPGARVLEIGAVSFKMDANYEAHIVSEFESNIDYLSMPESEFTDDVKTIEWWNSQPKHLRDAAFNGDESIYAAMERLILWVIEQRSTSPTNSLNVWGNAPCVDCALITYCFDHLNFASPWAYWEEKDVRTVYDLCTQIHNVDWRRTLTRPGTHHKAIDDAKFELIYLQKSLQTLANGKVCYGSLSN